MSNGTKVVAIVLTVIILVVWVVVAWMLVAHLREEQALQDFEEPEDDGKQHPPLITWKDYAEAIFWPISIIYHLAILPIYEKIFKATKQPNEE